MFTLAPVDTSTPFQVLECRLLQCLNRCASNTVSGPYVEFMSIYLAVFLFSVVPNGAVKETHTYTDILTSTDTHPPTPATPATPTHTIIHTYTHTYIHTYIYINMYVRTHTRTHTHTRKQTMHTHRYIYTRTSAHRDLNRESFYKFPGFFFLDTMSLHTFPTKAGSHYSRALTKCGRGEMGKGGYWFTDIPLLLAKQGMLNKVHLCYWCRCPDAHSYANYILTFQAVISFLSSVC